MSTVGAEVASPDFYPTKSEIILRPFYNDGVAIDDRPYFEVDDQIAANDLGNGDTLVHVHLANVGLLAGTSHMQDAFQNVRSIYYEEHGVKMCKPLFAVPVMEALGLDRFEPVGQVAMTLSFEINETGIGGIHFGPSRIQAHGNTYAKFNRRLLDGDHAAMAAFKTARLITTHLLGEYAPPITYVEDLVAAFMLAANVLIRKTIDTEERPLLKRNFAPNSNKGRANFSVVALGHAAYSGRKICKFTSPLRLVEHAINHVQATSPNPRTEQEMSDFADYLNAREVELTRQQRRHHGMHHHTIIMASPNE